MNKNILFISYDGMTDQLGQSQVIPYLIGLSRKGYNITLLSCEKSKAMLNHRTEIYDLLSANQIKWANVIYKNNLPILSPFLNYFLLKRKAYKLHQQNDFSVIHCRSSIPALIGLSMKWRFGTKFIFDMRGFWADEKVDAGLWDLRNPIYRIVYRYFKNKESKLLLSADSIVSLTEAAKIEILNGMQSRNGSVEFSSSRFRDIPSNRIHVIPCCVDTKHFDPENYKHIKLSQQLKQQLKIEKEDFIISYLGALGTWYLMDEMLLFFKRLLIKIPHAKFLFITSENRNSIIRKAKRLNIEESRIIIRPASRAEVPALLLLSTLSVFFIKQSFSKIASSPTKMAEVMAMGIPIICNNNVGDIESIVNSTHCGIVIKSFTEQEFDRAISKLNDLFNLPSKDIRQHALNLFSLEGAIEEYKKIYESVTK